MLVVVVRITGHCGQCTYFARVRALHIVRTHNPVGVLYCIVNVNTVMYSKSKHMTRALLVTFARASIETRIRFCELLTIDTYAMDSVGCSAVRCCAQGELKTLLAQSQFLCVPHADYQRIMARQAERIVNVHEAGRVVLVKQTLQQHQPPPPPPSQQQQQQQPSLAPAPARPLHLILKVYISFKCFQSASLNAR